MIGLLVRAGPLSLLGASFVLMAGGLLITDLRAGLLGLAALALVLPLLAAGGRLSPWRVAPGIVAFASVAWSNWFLAADRDVAAAVVAGLRVAFAVVPGLVFAGFIDPSALGDHLAQRLRMPARPVLAAVAALQRVNGLAEDWALLERTRRVRGLGPRAGPLSRGRYYAGLTFALLVGALRQAHLLATAMDARGYGRLARRGHGRTWAEAAPWTAADTALLAIAAALAALAPAIQYFS